MKGDGKVGVGEVEPTTKHYSHRLEFSETCLECQGMSGNFILVTWWEPCEGTPTTKSVVTVGTLSSC